MKHTKSFLIGAFALLLTAVLMLYVYVERKSPPAWANLPPSRHDGLAAKYSTDVLPASQEKFNYTPSKHDTPIVVAHDTPTLDARATGPYSYLGAAREFKYCTGKTGSGCNFLTEKRIALPDV